MNKMAMALFAMFFLGGCSWMPWSGDRAAAESVGPYPLPPESVSSFVYECGGGQRLVARYIEGQMSLRLPEGERPLHPVESASGSRYADDEVMFWIRNDEALFERAGTKSVCRLNHQQTVLERARLRGVDYRAVGQEPGWFVELSRADDMVVELEYGADKRRYETPDPDREAVRWTYVRGWWPRRMTLVIESRECRDTMSGERFDTEAILTWRGEEYRGCGTWLMPVR